MVPYVVGLTLQNIPMYQMYNTNCEWHAAGSVLRITGRVALDEMSLMLLRVMQAVMWVLAAAAFTATVWWVLQPPRAGSGMRYDLLSFSAALLFALPAMRGLWPAAPPGGTVADGMHIYAQLLLISFAILLQLGKFLYEECCKRADSLSATCVLSPSPPASVAVCTNTRKLAAAHTCSDPAVRLAAASWPLANDLGVVQRSTWSVRM